MASNAPAAFISPDAITAAVTIQVNLFIYTLIALVVILRIPQLIGLLQSRCGRPFFQLLGSATTTSPPKSKLVKQPSTGSQFYGGTSSKKWLETSSVESFDTRASKFEVFEERKGTSVPFHIPSTPSFLSPLVTLLRVRIIPGYSLMQVVVLVNYFYILLYGAFRESNVFRESTRSGWIAVSQLPLIFALAQKSSILGSLLGYGYESLNYIHRFAGILAVIAGNIHSLYYIYKWTEAGTFAENIAIPGNAWGFTLLFAMDMLYFFSISFWRRNAYNLFLWTHTIGIIIVFPAACLHRPGLRPYVYACIAIYLADRLMRLVKSRVTTATITNLPVLDMAYIELPGLNTGWRAGQHVRLRILSSGMGLFGWTESHPFTIASASGSQEGLVLMVKQAGDWTKRLVDLSRELAKDEDGHAKLKVWVEGPFGGPSRMVFSSFSAAVFVVGGSGITFGLSMVEELLMKDVKVESRVKYIELVWVVPDPASITPLIPIFSSLIQQSEYSTLRITIHYTRALTEKAPVFGRVEAPPCTSITIVHPNLTLTPGRPKLKNILDVAIDNALGFIPGKGGMGVSGLAVGVCGPVGLGEEAVRAVNAIDVATKFRVGGVEIHEETFGW